jgi:hypothetical protein
MLNVLLTSAAAASLTIPVRASIAESVEPGEAPTVGRATGAKLTVSNPATGKRFGVGGEVLAASRREASGTAPVVFAGSPAGSVRTWAVYLLDEEGEPIGDPEVVDVAFDEAGQGTVAARPVGAGVVRRVMVMTEAYEVGGNVPITTASVVFGERVSGGGFVVIDSTTLPQSTVSYGDAVSPEGGTVRPVYGGNVRVEVQDRGVEAAFVGIVELASGAEASDILPEVDLDRLDAAGFAAFQGLVLDAIAPVDTYRVEVEGKVDVAGLTVADGLVEDGDELRWEVNFLRQSAEGAWGAAGAATWLEPVARVKRRTGEAAPVVLRSASQVYESSDASQALTLAGDLSLLSAAASLELWEGGAFRAASDVVALEPDGGVVRARGPATLPETWEEPQGLWTLSITDTNGRRPETREHPLRLRLAALYAREEDGPVTRTVYVGEVLGGDPLVDVRRVRLVVRDNGTAEWVVDARVGEAPFPWGADCEAARRKLLWSSEKGSCTALGDGRLVFVDGNGGRTVADARALFPVRTTDLGLLAEGLSFALSPNNGGDTISEWDLQHWTPQLKLPAVVTGTTFTLGFAFPGDIDGSDAVVHINLDPAEGEDISWSVVEGIATGTLCWPGDDAADGCKGTPLTVDADDVDLTPAGDIRLRGLQDAAALRPAGSTLQLTVTPRSPVRR